MRQPAFNQVKISFADNGDQSGIQHLDTHHGAIQHQGLRPSDT